MTTIPSAQLDAITRLEFAAIAADRARRALAHPDLQMGDTALLAPSGHKHLTELRAAVAEINRSVHGSGATGDSPELNSGAAQTSMSEANSSGEHPQLSVLGQRAADTVGTGFATDLRAAFDQAREQLSRIPELRGNAELLQQVLEATLRNGSRFGRRIYRACQDNAPDSAFTR